LLILYAKRQEWVVSGLLAESYISISCTSAFGATTDIGEITGMDMGFVSVLLSSARNGSTALIKLSCVLTPRVSL
jgi:hypothetical protein